jgi:hypothetical protein
MEFSLVTQSAELIGLGISPSQGLYLHTKQHKHRINAHNTHIHALNAIRTYDPIFQASQESSCLDRAATVIGKVILQRREMRGTDEPNINNFIKDAT